MSSRSPVPDVLSAEAFCCPPLPSSVITAFVGTMGESDSSAVFVRTHHCLGRCSLLLFFTEPLRPPGYVEHNNVRYAALLDSGAFSQSRLATDPYWRPLEVHDRPAQSILYRSSITSRFRITASLLSGLRLNAIVGLWRSKVSIPAARYALPGWIPTSFMLSTEPAHASCLWGALSASHFICIIARRFI